MHNITYIIDITHCVNAYVKYFKKEKKKPVLRVIIVHQVMVETKWIASF